MGQHCTQTHTGKRAQTFTHDSRPQTALCVVIDVCVYFGATGVGDETAWKALWSREAHTHTYTQTRCLLPAKTTKQCVPFPLITAVVQLT